MDEFTINRYENGPDKPPTIYRAIEPLPFSGYPQPVRFQNDAGEIITAYMRRISPRGLPNDFYEVEVPGIDE